MLFNRTEKYALLLFVGLSAAAFVHAQSIEDSLTPVRENACLAQCERYRQECNDSAQGDAAAHSQCETTVTTPCVTACNEGRTFTPPPYPVPAPVCTQDTWVCGEWSACEDDGEQERECRKTDDCDDVDTKPPEERQSCMPPADDDDDSQDGDVATDDGNAVDDGGVQRQGERQPAEEEDEEEAIETVPVPPVPQPVLPQGTDDDAESEDEDERETEDEDTDDEDIRADDSRAVTPPRPLEDESRDDDADDDSDRRRGTESADRDDAAEVENESGDGDEEEVDEKDAFEDSVIGEGHDDRRIAGECTAAGLAPQECFNLMVRGFGLEDCALAGITTREACAGFLTERNGGTFPGCEGSAPERCEAVQDVLLVRYLAEDEKDVADRLLQTMIEERTVEPIAGLTSISEARAKDAAWWRSQGDGSTSAGVVVLDADRDGLPDDFERQLGLDPLNEDTDGDGIRDDAELRLGSADLGPTARAIVNRAPLGQPRGQGETDEEFEANVGEDGRLYGFCDPNATCLVFIYSYIPTVFTVKADENGEWAYDLGDQLSEGSHVAYVTVSEEGGAVDRKSNPLAFFVTEAQAVTTDPNEYLGAAPIVAAQRQKDSTTLWYVLGTVAAVLAAGGAAFAVLRPKAVTVK